MRKDEFYYPSRDGNTEVHAIAWRPEGEMKAILQLSHGMVEYTDRYHDFAAYLCSQGICVVGNDHLGHGKSVQARTEYGYFTRRCGNACLLGDMHTLRQRMQERHPGVPYFLLGHSMGSALVRQYMALYGDGLKGVLLLGVTKNQSRLTLTVGQGLCLLLGLLRGGHHRSRLVNRLAIGCFNRRFKPCRTRADWVTSDPEKLEAYVKDPLCSFTFTVNAYYNLMQSMRKLRRKEALFMIPKGLPILLAAGTEDPVGGFGRGVRKIYTDYRRAGLRDVTLQLYPGARHELLQETIRERVYKDLYDWIRERISL